MCGGSIPPGEYIWCSDECFYIESKWYKVPLARNLPIGEYYLSTSGNCIVCRQKISRPAPEGIERYYCSELCQQVFKKNFRLDPKLEQALNLAYLSADLLRRYG